MRAGALQRLVDGAAAAHPEPPSLKERYRGVLLGLAVGNALGLPFEGESRAALHRRFRHGVSEIDPREKDRPWDDDVAQTAVVAEAALADDLDLEDLARRLVQWARQNGRGMGALTRQVISELASGTPATEAAHRVWELSGWSAAGNGAVMRCAPVAMRWRLSGAKLIGTADRSALVTHYDSRCRWSAVAVVVALAICLRGSAVDLPTLAAAVAEADEDTEAADGRQQVAEAIREVEGAKLDDLELDDPMDMGYTLKAMKVALWALSQPADLQSVLVEVVSAGGDTDTNGAVAGAVMGARTGAGSIPSRWLQNVAATDRLIELADRLHLAAGPSRG